MSITSRINPKTKEIEYRVHFRFNDGVKVKQSNTKWCKSASEAQKIAQEKIALNTNREISIEKESDEQTFKDVYCAFLDKLKVNACKETTQNVTTAVTLYRRAKTVLASYVSTDLQEKAMSEVNKYDFKKWLILLNNSNIAGATVRNYKSVIFAFNDYCELNDVYSEEHMADDIRILLSKVRLKSKTSGKRDNRYNVYLSDVKKIGDYYKQKGQYGIGSYENEYWYNLFYVLFYSGMRVEELIALQWKNVDFNKTPAVIRIVNAITEREPRVNVELRLKHNVNNTKNKSSRRVIPILRYYSDMFKSFRNSTIMKFNYSEEQLNEAFVFPNINAKDPKDRTWHTSSKNIRRELDRVCKAVGVPKTDCQMFRHGCAMLLVLSQEDGGLGYEATQVKNYFGHTDDKMLNQVYTALNNEEKARKLAVTLKEIVGETENTELNIDNKKVLDRLVDPSMNEENVDKTHYLKIKNQLQNALDKGQWEFTVFPEDEKMVRRFREEKWNETHDFIEEEIDLVYPNNERLDYSYTPDNLECDEIDWDELNADGLICGEEQEFNIELDLDSVFKKEKKD